MRFAHVGLTVGDADRQAKFYPEAVGRVDRRPPRQLTAKTVARGNGLRGANIRSTWLCFAETLRRFLVILENSPAKQPAPRAVNATGWGHIALKVVDLRATADAVLRLGGRLQGEITTLGGPDHAFEVVYIRDPEGNVVELEQDLDR